MFNEKEDFRKVVEKIANSIYNEKTGKAQLSRVINKWLKQADEALIKDVIREIIDSFEGKLPQWVVKRFCCIPGSYWQERSDKYSDIVLGWIDSSQVEATRLPLKLWYQNFTEDRYCEVLDWDEPGFAAAVDLPIVENIGYSGAVGVCVNIPADKLHLFAPYGYAAPCAIQWERRLSLKSPFADEDGSGFYVTRSIISHGFWKAWKWWPDCWEWYLDKRPELFEDMEWWGNREPIRHEPRGNLYAAVLGGSLEYQERIRKLSLFTEEEE